jgi:hypothetical protein
MRIVSLLLLALLQVGASARIAIVSGDAEIVRSDRVTRANTGDSIAVGDSLHTRSGASASVSLSSGVIFLLHADTRLELKKIDGEPVVFLADGVLNVKNATSPVRVESKAGVFVSNGESQEFEIRNGREGLQVATSPVRVYEAGSISASSPKAPGETTVIVYPSVRRKPTPK